MPVCGSTKSSRRQIMICSCPRANQQQRFMICSCPRTLPSHTFFTTLYSLVVIGRPLCQVGPMVAKLGRTIGRTWFELIVKHRIWHTCKNTRQYTTWHTCKKMDEATCSVDTSYTTTITTTMTCIFFWHQLNENKREETRMTEKRKETRRNRETKFSARSGGHRNCFF